MLKRSDTLKRDLKCLRHLMQNAEDKSVFLYPTMTRAGKAKEGEREATTRSEKLRSLELSGSDQSQMP